MEPAKTSQGLLHSYTSSCSATSPVSLFLPCGWAQTQILPFVQNGAFQLEDSDDIIRILEAAFGDPDSAATVAPNSTA